MPDDDDVGAGKREPPGLGIPVVGLAILDAVVLGGRIPL